MTVPGRFGLGTSSYYRITDRYIPNKDKYSIRSPLVVLFLGDVGFKKVLRNVRKNEWKKASII